MKTCDQIIYQTGKDGLPDMIHPRYCMKQATTKIQYKENKEPSWFCDEHIPLAI